MSARVVTSTPVLTPRGSVARGRSNGSVSRVVVVGGEGSLSRVVVARARADGKMKAEETTTKTTTKTMVALAPVVSGACCAEAANAAVDPIASALAAYGHYLGLVLVVGALATEKWTVKANMSEEEEQRLVVADSVYGIAGVLVLYRIPSRDRIRQGLGVLQPRAHLLGEDVVVHGDGLELAVPDDSNYQARGGQGEGRRRTDVGKTRDANH